MDETTGTDRRAVAIGLAHAMAAAAVGGGLTGLIVGGVLGRLAMRLLAATSPPAAQGGITDDQAVVGIVSLAGSVTLALLCLGGGAVVGLVLLLARRILPTPARRTAGSAVVAAAVGGGLFVHGRESFDFTVLQPVWLAVAVFVALPLLYGLVTPAVTDAVGARAGWWLVPLGVLALVQPPAMAAAVLAFGVALVVATTGPLDRLWRGRAVTVAGTGLFALLVAWGLYDLVADIVSLAT